LRSGGSPLAPDVSADLGARLGHDLTGVRIHTDASAVQATRAINARAFAVGHDIAFAPNEFAPQTTSGRRLLAHELAHVIQPAGLSQTIRRAPDRGDIEASDVDTPDQPVVYGPDYEVDLTVEDPTLPDERHRKQTFRLHLPYTKPPLDLKFWVVPVNKLQLPRPSVPPPSVKQAPSAFPDPNTPPPSHPDIPPGTTVRALDGARLTALASTPQHIITAEASKFAVGAASTTAIKLSDGSVIIIDAGVNSRGIGTTQAALEALVMQRLEAFIGNGVVRDLLFSHLHGDHFSLAPAIMRRFVVSVVRINDVMRRWAGAREGRAAMKEAEAARIEASEKAFNTQMEGRRAAWEADAGAAFAPDAREVEWRKFVREQFEKTPQSKGATERVLVQTKGNVIDVVDFDLQSGQKSRRGPAPFEAEDPYIIAETQKPIESKRVLDRRRKTESRDIDPNATAYVITLPSGASWLILPDLRARDLEALTENFKKIMGDLKRPVQIWDATHHMQKGWYKFSGIAPASQLAKVARFLSTFKTSEGADVVMVSAQIDLNRPDAKTLVDPVNIRLLRSLGFEVYLAASGREVHLIDITTAQGTKLTGILATKAPGEGQPKVSAGRAELALKKLVAERQARLVEAKEEADPAKQAEIQRRIAEITSLEQQITNAYHEMLAEMEVNLRRAGSHTTGSLAHPQVTDFPKQRALDLLLEQHGFDLPAIRNLELTEMALVVLNRPPDLAGAPPGSPGARARELAGVRSRINELGLRMKAGEDVRVELATEFEQYRALLENELNPPDPAQKPLEGTSKDLLNADLADVKTRLAGLREGEGTTEYSRAIGTGDLIAQHTTVLKPMPLESAALRGTRQVADVVGRAGGLVMVVSTVAGEGDLLKRWKQGAATAPETIVGTAHNLVAGGVGLQMLRGVKVNPGVFVLIAVLEVTEVWLRHYPTEEQHDIATIRAAASASVNLACMGIGMAVMAIPHPAAVIAGLIIMTLGPLLLNALGLDEWIADWSERRGAFNPGAVVEVLQKLRKLLKSYQLVVGSIELAKRAGDPNDPTMSGLPDAAKRADDVRRAETQKALNLEQEILSEFESAYGDAKTDYAGLKDLDDYRAQFYHLRKQAGLAGVTDMWQGVFGIRSADAVFKAIDAGMSIEKLSAWDIALMPQWSRLRKELDELDDLVGGDRDEDYHSKVRDKDKRVQAMIDNARYRIEPTAQGQERAKAILPEGAPGRQTYDALLHMYEARLASYRRKYVERTMALCGVSLAPAGQDPSAAMADPLNRDWVLSMAEGTIKGYRISVEAISGFGPPPELLTALYTHADGAERYKGFIKQNPYYASELDRLETTDRMITGQLTQAERTINAEPPATQAADKQRLQAADKQRLQAARDQMNEARSKRYDKRGMLYPSEVDALRTGVWKSEVEHAAALFSTQERAVAPLTEAEELALVAKRSEFESDVRVRPPLSRRLMIVRSPTAVDPRGNLAYIFRLTGEVPLYFKYSTGAPVHVDKAQNAIVGIAAASDSVGPDGQLYPYVTVVPLNESAIAVFRGVNILKVPRDNLAPVTGEELDKANAALAAEKRVGATTK
jgi:hypothetical protein